jgi:transposase, IS5 family
MLSKKKLAHQLDMFNSIGDQINQKHSLYILANKLKWEVFDEAFAKFYCSDNGRPAKPIRLMVSLLILKHLRNLSDESVQYFSGSFKFSADIPVCQPSW